MTFLDSNSFEDTNLKNIFNIFRDNGIITINNIFSDDDINKIKSEINAKVDTFEQVETDIIYSLNLFDLIFNKKLRYLINKFIPDGILWMLFYLKTKNNNANPHFDPQTEYGSWHRDRITDYNHNRIDFIDIMIYLTDVGENDGAFAFLPISPDKEDEINEANKSSKILGKAGTCIFSRIDWYHTATPNLGKKNREILRISFAKNMYDCRKQEESSYKKIRENYLDKDPFMYFLFGGRREWYKFVEQPPQNENTDINFNIPPLNYHFKKSYKNIFKNKLKKLLR